MPTSYELFFKVRDCEAVDIDVFDTAGGQRIFQSIGRPVTGAPDAVTGLRLVLLSFTPTQAQRKACNAAYHVVVTCHANKECKAEGSVTVSCKNGGGPPPIVSCSPTTAVAVRDSAGVEVDIGQPCLDHGIYTIEVISPWSATAQAQWSVTVLPASGGNLVTTAVEDVHGRQYSYTLPDGKQPPDTARLINVSVVDMLQGALCISQGVAMLPPVHPTKCPTAIALELRRNGAVLQPASSDAVTATFVNLPAGFYELSVADPLGSTYDWFTGGATAAQSGPSITFGVDLSATNSPREVEVFVETGECCPMLRRKAVLTMAEAGTPPEEEPPVVIVDPPVTPTFPSWCGFVRALLALALVILFFSILFAVCPSLLMPVALAAAGAAALVAVICLALCLALCGLSFCGFWGIVIWALRWAIVLAIIAAILWFIALFVLALPLVMCVLLGALIYGIICGLLIVWVTRSGCRIPDFMSWP